MVHLLTIFRLSRPLLILLAALTYVLGAGIARYLGHPPVFSDFWLGLIGVLLAQMSMSLLVEVFRPANEPRVADESLAQRKAIYDSALYVSIAALSSDAVIAFLLYKDSSLTPPAFLFLAISLLVLIIYSVPPARVFDKGFGELMLSVHLAYVIPSISFLLQAGYMHTLLNAALIPLTFLSFAAFLALDFPSYAEDLKYGRGTLLVRMGWERAVPLHHGLVIAAYVLFMLAPLLGFTLRLLWPAFLTLPFALLQIYWLLNIALGAKPIWSLLSANAISLFGLTAYFLTLTFWLR